VRPVRRKRLLARSQARGGAGRSLASDPITSHAFPSYVVRETHSDVQGDEKEKEAAGGAMGRTAAEPATNQPMP
jgi:hypothetical protein